MLVYDSFAALGELSTTSFACIYLLALKGNDVSTMVPRYVKIRVAGVRVKKKKHVSGTSLGKSQNLKLALDFLTNPLTAASTILKRSLMLFDIALLSDQKGVKFFDIDR